MKYLVTILLSMSFLLHSTEKKQIEKPIKPNATVWQDGDGMMVIYFYGHYFFCYPNHSEKCPCKADLH